MVGERVEDKGGQGKFLRGYWETKVCVCMTRRGIEPFRSYKAGRGEGAESAKLYLISRTYRTSLDAYYVLSFAYIWGHT